MRTDRRICIYKNRDWGGGEEEKVAQQYEDRNDRGVGSEVRPGLDGPY